MEKTVPISTLRNYLSDAVDEVEKKNSYMLVTKRGEPVSVLVDIDLFEDLLALSSSRYLKSIKEAREDAKKGALYSHEDVFGSV